MSKRSHNSENIGYITDTRLLYRVKNVRLINLNNIYSYINTNLIK